MPRVVIERDRASGTAKVRVGSVLEAGYSVSSEMSWAAALRYAVSVAGLGATVMVRVMEPGGRGAVRVYRSYPVQLPRPRPRQERRGAGS